MIGVDYSLLLMQIRTV